MEAIHVPLEPNLKQAMCLDNLLDEDCPLHGFVGGVGGGKTQLLCQASTDVTVTIPNNIIAVARKFRVDVESTTMREFKESLNPHFILEERKKDATLMIRSCDENYPSELRFLGIDDIDRWGSTQFGHIFLDEANEIDPADLVFLWGRLRRNIHPKNPPPLSEMWRRSPYVSTKNPNDIIRFILFIANPPREERHWINELVERGTFLGKPQKAHITHVTTYDNEENLPQSFLQNLETLPELEYERMVEGKQSPGVQGPPCTPDFSMERNTFSDPWPTFPVNWVRGWDPGWFCGVCVWCTFDGGIIYVWKELVTHNQTTKDLIREKVKAQEKRSHHSSTYKDWVDHFSLNHHSPQSEKSNADILRDHGYHPLSRFSTPKAVAQLLNDLFKAGRLKIHKEFCPKLIRAFRGAWGRDNISGDPVKDGVYDHFTDACGYAIWGELGVKGRRTHVQEPKEIEELPLIPRYVGKKERKFSLPGFGRAS